MKIIILQVGKAKENEVQMLCDEWIKRLSPFLRIEIKTLKETSPSKTFPIDRCIAEEGKGILDAVDKDSFVVALDEKGREMKSIEFADFLATKQDEGRTVTFIIGGAFGLSDEVKKRADILMSMSKMTFTHQMVRLFLLEQIYRGFCIIKGKEYHHE